ncbi:MAG: flavodoxin family protein [Chitinophagaceae bacterium]|nr:MAG: flavodoxin family protein [Chitinophagaceae bacterium]
MKTLIIVVHPEIQTSLINSRWVGELGKFPDKYTLHQLYEVYPDGVIDVESEQKLLEGHERIVFQFPFYWFSSPPLLKKWLDEVLLHGWAFGSKSGYKLGGKKIALAISAGIALEGYSKSGPYKYTMEELTRPFELTFEYVRATYKSPFVYYDMEFNATAQWVEASVEAYLGFIDRL